ncbi:MAG: hypothetical protein KJ831_07070, partial [Candidatus Eisenbacteria bacterium]|nr:hypothetical protein [Candidatus Eisenbacteria bacterium]
MTALLLGLNQSTHAYWPTSIDDPFVIGNDPNLGEGVIGAMQFQDNRVLLVYGIEPNPQFFQIIDWYGEYVFEEPIPVAPGLEEGCGVKFIFPDGEDGAYLVFNTGQPSFLPIGAQRIDSLGNRLWGDEGRIILGVDVSQWDACLSDDYGIIVAATVDEPTDWYDVIAQKIDAEGNLLWGPEGVVVSGLPSNGERNPAVASDGSGGMFVAWEDGRLSYPTVDIFSQHLDANGNALWAEDLLIFEYPWYHNMISDGEGGFIIEGNSGGGASDHWRFDADGNELWHREALTWYLYGFDDGLLAGNTGYFHLGFPTRMHVYGQKIDVNGNNYWPMGGGPLGASFFANTIGWKFSVEAAFSFQYPWHYALFEMKPPNTPYRGSRFYISRLDSLGNRDWGDDGVIIAESASADIYLRDPILVSFSDGGAFCAYGDEDISSPTWDDDAYAIHVHPNGTIGGPLHLLVDLEPELASIQIPPTGGSFTYNVAIADTYVVYSDFDAWIEVAMPGGDTREITVREGIHIDSNSVIERFDVVQNVPDWAPVGGYTYTLYVGDHDYPDWFWAMDEFGFEKLSSGSLRGSEPITSAND